MSAETAPAQPSVSYPNRIVVYLAPPGSRPACIGVRGVTDGSFIARTSFQVRELAPNQAVVFTLTAVTGVIPIDLLGIGWIGGCGFYGQILLGSNGVETAKRLGIVYAETGTAPCKVLKGVYHGTGELVIQDHLGISFQAYLPRSYSEGLCITLTVNPGTSAKVSFPDDMGGSVEI